MSQQKLRRAEPAQRMRATLPNRRPAAGASVGRAAVQRAAADPSAASAREILALQRTAGNRAVSRLLTGSGAAGRPVIQAKLTVGPAGDRYEQEADRVADQVVGASGTGSSPELQRLIDDGTFAQRAPLVGPISPLVRSAIEADSDLAAGVLAQRAAVDGSFAADSTVESRLAASRGGGQPLPETTRAQLEPRFGADFSQVRVHTGAQAVQLNRDIQAQAFTHGHDIFFGAGKYDPATGQGKHLLAHELTHVVQQTGGNRLRRKAGQAGIAIQGGLPADRLSTKKVKKYLDFVKMKRNDTQIAKMLLNKIGLTSKPDDAYGHWWTEIGDLNGDNWQPLESYGWWPSERGMTIKKTLGGVSGVLNSPAHGGTPTQDPHHGDPAGQEFHPVMEVDDTADYKALRQKVVTDIRSFAQGFKGSWNWRLGWGKNCHTFQERLKKAVGIHHQKGKSWLKRPDTAGTLQEAEAEQKRQKDEEAESSIPGPVYQLKEDLKAGSMPGGDDIDIPAGSKIKVTQPPDFPGSGMGMGDVEIRWNKRDCYAWPDYIVSKGERVS